MIKRQNILAAVLATMLFSAGAMPALAQSGDAGSSAPAAAAAPGTAPNAVEPTGGANNPSSSSNNAGGGAQAASATVNPPVPEIHTQPWSFAGIFGRYDRNQLRRGFAVFRQVCSNCHSAHLFRFRNLEEPGGPEYTDAQVKALAASYEIDDPTAKGGKRPGVPSDTWPSPFPSEQAAREANGGALPPDWSELAKARTIERPFPWWIIDWFTTYQEGGPDYVHALMTGYRDQPPPGFKLPEGKYYNVYFPGHAISMPPPLSDGIVKYTPGADGSTVPETVDQYSRDAAAFMVWLGDPTLDERKEAGFRVLTFLILFAVIMWMVKRRIWANVEH